MSAQNRIGVVIVTYGHDKTVAKLLDRVYSQLADDDQIVVVDHKPDGGSAAVAAAHSSKPRVIRADNRGFSAGCNLGAAALKGEVELLYFLNPDTLLAPGSLEPMRQAAATNYDAWMALLLLPNGKVNSAGNVVHTSGLSWCDGYLDEVSRHSGNAAITVLSGACMMVRAAAWENLGGLDESFFLYYEDVDLSTRLLLRGMKLGVIGAAHVVHDYTYDNPSNNKWFYLERNRYIYIIRTWPGPVIALLLPQLILVELGLWAVSILQGRFVTKVRSAVSLLGRIGPAFADRAKIQKTRVISSRDFMLSLRPTLDTELLGAVGKSKIINNFFILYRRVAIWLLSFGAKSTT